MKLGNQRKSNVDNNNQQSQAIKPKIEAQGKDLIDDFHATVFNSGNELLSELDRRGVEFDAQQYKKTYNYLKALENFQYNIAFAGEQSSGKSTVINALIEYPLMPTCKLTTTCVGTKLIYSKKTRIIVTDDDSKRKVLDVDCTNISQQHFMKLKEYACIESSYKLIENLQYFTDRNLFNKNETLTLDTIDELKMDRSNPDHVALLVMILLTVYVDQNSTEHTAKAEAVIKKRDEVLRFFNFPKNTLNYSITLMWNGDFLKSGMTITDLPGLGAYAPNKEVDGKVQKGHDAITTDALGGSTDAMVFLVDPEVRNGGAPAIEAMLSNAGLRELVGDDVIIPVINKIDLCEGDAIVEQSIDGFTSLMQGAGVKKTREDIKLCSSFFGEAEYKNIQIERSCFYKKNFSTIYEEIEYDSLGESEQEIIEKVKSAITKKLKIAYNKKSHIEELKQFFRSSYVQKGKCCKVYAALFEIINLSENTLNTLNTKKNNYKSLKDLQLDAIVKITTSVARQASTPIQRAMTVITPLIDKSLENADQTVKTKLDKIPEKYLSTFNESIENYSEKLLKIANEFDVFADGWGNKARIDKPGTKNHRLYNQLNDECKIIDVDIKKINKSYADILGFVTDDITKIYNSALDELHSIKMQFSKSMAEAVDEMLRDDELMGSAEAIESLSCSVTDYVEKQISMLENKADISISSINDIGKSVVNSIINFNSECAESFKLWVVNQIQGALKPGSIFASREYITINGADGLKILFNNLGYSSEDEEFIGNNIRQEGTVGIYNNINKWYSDASTTITSMFTELSDQIDKMMKSTKDMLTQNAQAKEQEYENVVNQIIVCEDKFVTFRNNVQQLFDLTLETTDDKNIISYQGDIFKNLKLKR